MSVEEVAEIIPFDPNAVAESQHREHPVWRRLGGLALSAGIVLAPVVASTLYNVNRPVDIKLANGLHVSASPQFSDTTSIDFGTIGSVYLPAAHERLPYAGSMVSAKVSVPEVDVAADEESLNAISPIVDNFSETAIDPFVRRVEINALKGFVGGILIGAAGLALYLSHGKRKREDHDVRIAEQHHATVVYEVADRTDNPQLVRSYETYRHAVHRLTKFELWRSKRVLGGLMAAGLVLSMVNFDDLPRPFGHEHVHPTTAPLDKLLAERSPWLSDAWVSGTGNLLLNQGAHRLGEYMQNADAVMQRNATNFNQAYEAFLQTPAAQILKNPNIVTMLQVSDIHGNIPWMRYVMNAQLSKFRPDAIINTGDTYTTANTMLNEKPIMSTFMEAIDGGTKNNIPIKIIWVGGNHDPLKLPNSIANITFKGKDGKTYRPIVQLDKDNHYTAVVDGITFVGAPDPTKSLAGGTVPSDYTQQLKLIAKQGHTIAEAAGKAYADTGVEPIVLAHEPEAGYETIARGVGDVLSGHLHVTKPTTADIGTNGSEVTQQTLGTASGAGTDAITEYSPSTVDEVTRLHIYDAITHQEIATIDTSISPEGKVSLQLIHNNDPKPIPIDADDIKTSFLHNFAPDALLIPDSAPTATPTPSLTHNEARVRAKVMAIIG